MSDYESEEAKSSCSEESDFDAFEHSYGDDEDQDIEADSNEESGFEVMDINDDLVNRDDYYKKMQKDEEKIVKVPADQRITNNVLSKYEKAKVLGVRASQIAKNSPIYANIDPERLHSLNALDIAELELQQKTIPFIIRRFLPDGQFE